MTLPEDLEKYLTFLAVDGEAAASSRNQALSAIPFLYNEVLDIPPGTDLQFIGTKRTKRLPGRTHLKTTMLHTHLIKPGAGSQSAASINNKHCQITFSTNADEPFFFKHHLS